MPDFPQASSFNRLIDGKIGFLTRSLAGAFSDPGSDPMARAGKRVGTYSSGYCSGFKPDSLILSVCKVNYLFLFCNSGNNR